MTIPEQKIFITVKGFYIFLGQCFAKEINFYLPQCVQKEPFMSNIKVLQLTMCIILDSAISEEEKKIVLEKGFTIE